MSEEEIKKIAKETFDENIMNNLDSSIVFKYVQILEKENKKYKEVINKALNLNEKITNMRGQGFSYEQYKPYLLKQQNILKEVEHE